MLWTETKCRLGMVDILGQFAFGSHNVNVAIVVNLDNNDGIEYIFLAMQRPLGSPLFLFLSVHWFKSNGRTHEFARGLRRIALLV